MMIRWVWVGVWVWLLVGCTTAGETREATPTPGKVAATAVATPTAATKSAGTMTDTVKGDLGAKLDEYMTRLAALGYAGPVLVAKDGEIVLAKGYGLADRARNIPVTPDTVVSTGSITKQFTAAAILKLEEQGKLSVNDPIAKYFQNAPPDKTGITLHHLLTHSAGFPGAIGDDYTAIGRDEYIRKALATPLNFPPGAEYDYSNVGYSLLGAIVELLSQQGYEAFLNDNLFKPAGMTQTGYKLPQWPKDRLAHGYARGEDRGTMLDRAWDADGPYWNLRANGGIQTTIGDMYRWHRALEGDTVLSSASRQKLFTPHVSEGPRSGSFYGYGWAIFKDPQGGKLVAHNGGDGVFAADFRRYVDAGLVVFIASSDQAYRAWHVSEPLEAILFSKSYTLPPRLAPIPAATLTSYAGTYRLPSGDTVTVAARDGALGLAGDGQAAYSLLQAGPPVDEARAKTLNQRAERIETERVKGNLAPLVEAFGGGLTEAEIKTQETTIAQRQAERFGALKEIKVVGTAADQEGPGLLTTVQLRFERGEVYKLYRWGPQGLMGLRLEDEIPSQLTLWPETATDFVSFSLTSQRQARVRFEGAGSGSPLSLVFKTPDGEVRAEKTP